MLNKLIISYFLIYSFSVSAYSIVYAQETTPSGFKHIGKTLSAPVGWQLVSNADYCLQQLDSGLITPLASFDVSFFNGCNFPIQASGCNNKKGTEGCVLPAPVILPPRTYKILMTIKNINLGDQQNVCACRVSTADGVAVKYDYVLSSNSKTDTVCLIPKSNN